MTEQVERDGYDQFWDVVESAPVHHGHIVQPLDALRSAWLVRDLTEDDFRTARAATAAMQKDAAMDRLVAEGQRCDAMTPQKGRRLPDRVMVWHSSPTLNHLGTWATTRYPDDAVAYVPESLEAPTAVLDETSPRAAIGEIGNQMHNLACEFQSNEDLAERLGGFACELRRVAQSASSEPIPTMTPQEAAKVSAEDRENIVDEIESIICETHEMDVRDIDYAENIVSWLERHHPAALRAISEDSQ